jgi:hypothetical protein
MGEFPPLWARANRCATANAHVKLRPRRNLCLGRSSSTKGWAVLVER